MGVNLSTDFPSIEPQDKWNVAQAVKFCVDTLNDDGPPSDKALAYCWLLHLVGDLHQPMHSTALFSERFPTGDRGGNSMPTVQNENLHALWDNLLGSAHKPNDVERTVAQLAAERFRPAKIDGDVEDWIAESHELAKSFAYSPEIIAAVQTDGELQPINLPKEYLTSAGSRARQRIVAAGLRAGTMINSLKPPRAPPSAERTTSSAADLGFGLDSPKRAEPKDPPSVSSEKTHWLNLNGNVRHNPSCRWFQNTKRGRMCTADEGQACGQCGG